MVTFCMSTSPRTNTQECFEAYYVQVHIQVTQNTARFRQLQVGMLDSLITYPLHNVLQSLASCISRHQYLKVGQGLTY